MLASEDFLEVFQADVFFADLDVANTVEASAAECLLCRCCIPAPHSHCTFAVGISDLVLIKPAR